MSNKPFFSVIIPCYNRALTIRPVLESVFSQTFCDFECLIIDDGSQDGMQLADVVASINDTRFLYIYRDNGGANAARNTGIDASKGEYLAFLDSDDTFLPSKLESDFAAIKQVDNPKTVIFSQVLVDRGVEKLWLKPSRAPQPREKIGDYLILRGGFTQTSTLVVKREQAQTVRFTEGLPMAQDYDFPIRLEAAGAGFFMKEQPSVIWNDIDNPSRVSTFPPFEPMLEWTENMRALIGEHGYYAFRGTHIARLAAPWSRGLAIRLFLQALLRFTMPPKLAVKAVIQIFFPRRVYRKVLDRMVAVRGLRR